MDLSIKDKLFIVGGATSGFGKSITERLIAEGAKVFAVARKEDRLEDLKKRYAGQLEYIAGNISEDKTIDAIYKKTKDQEITGMVINAGGPPATQAIETTMKQWDEAYQSVLRWKIYMVKKFLPHFLENKYGRIVFIESASVKQPVDNLVLSNSLRMAVVGYVKTLSQEIGKTGVTLNIMAPGFHMTPAAERVIVKKSETENISFEEAKKAIEANIKAKEMGSTDDFAILGAWLLSPFSQYINGQTISVDGGIVKSSFG